VFNSLVFCASAGIVGGLYLFFRGFHLLARKRLLLNTPTSKIRGASLGLVEVGGLAAGPYTIPAPITGKMCYLYRTTAWQQHDSGKNHDWKKIAEESLHVPFFLDDNTGQLLIDPEGAELDLHRDFHQEYSSSFFSTRTQVPAPVANFIARHGVEPAGRLRIEECSIKPKNALFILGTLAENPAREADPAYSLGSPLCRSKPDDPPGPPPEIIQLSEAAGPSAAREMTQQSKIAAALAKAGIQNPAAWAAAGVPYPGATVEQPPQVTEISVNGQCPARENGEQSPSDLASPVVLMKGENDPAFLISWRSQSDVVRSLAWKSAGMIWGGSALALLGLYVLLAQLELV
jgi:E3 Ubiquitin ligase